MDFMAVLREKLTEFGALITPEADLAAPVPSCGDWTFYDLADHVGQGNLWVVTAVAEGRGDYHGDPAPANAVELRAWFDQSAKAIVESLSVDPATPAWTFTSLMPRTVGFWQRRRAQETLMHLWDGQDALGTAEAIEPHLAADGITEVFEMFAHRMIQRGLAKEPRSAVRVHTTDTGDNWTYGPGAPVAEISGTASDLLLALWGRKSLEDAALSWQGNWAEGAGVLAGPLVP
ncbi:maleylpyruvate isomerase family mycothiol-dependent enzyme [Nocardia yunnanensis]|uniref:Maleylpyruvate isomerase family mycothiol-dependent enzyme n=1 Tax=Nocardia yunnanensis TaxID=2382165 RepID=A0A386Z9K4_9NOCA|nr:maleylpyruvate isomerase family mycothiol-dependent enzyme [Nocardia yunnanensis]AYF73285.1 maleylpyruvate isomerase family mycothiol-dependent enzyme [Nocardia yunnanensis]